MLQSGLGGAVYISTMLCTVVHCSIERYSVDIIYQYIFSNVASYFIMSHCTPVYKTLLIKIRPRDCTCKDERCRHETGVQPCLPVSANSTVAVPTLQMKARNQRERSRVFNVNCGTGASESDETNSSRKIYRFLGGHLFRVLCVERKTCFRINDTFLRRSPSWSDVAMLMLQWCFQDFQRTTITASCVPPKMC